MAIAVAWGLYDDLVAIGRLGRLVPVFGRNERQLFVALHAPGTFIDQHAAPPSAFGVRHGTVLLRVGKAAPNVELAVASHTC